MAGTAVEGGPTPLVRPRTVTLSGGAIVPYPEPANEVASRIGRANRRADTKPELLLRSALHRRGLRFRKDQLVRAAGVRVRPDVVFTRSKLAVFVDGCFWHQCPKHSSTPHGNPDYWIPKLQANIGRDRKVDAALAEEGWVVVRIWEHEDPESAAIRIGSLVDRSRPTT